ncbi:MAG: hypothetical protein IJ863_04985 [Spirochaetales bacterium]|nr:hypothetical protein [Spirochaetales bacterium]
MEPELEGVNFFGTDGIRGRVESIDLPPLEALRLFRRSAVITPALIELAVRAFVKMVSGDGESHYATGSDGRDAVTGNTFVDAMNRAFSLGGATVSYLGIVPTPAVPQFQLENGCLGAAMLTASHNPSNQNGIKFFHKGKKLLPEGEIGDRKLSSIMYELALQEQTDKQEGTIRTVDVTENVVRMLERAIPLQITKGMSFLVDTAAGAWTRFADLFFSRNSIAYRRISEDEKGYNINNHCGVAEIEGHRSFTRAEIPYSPAIIRALFENPGSYGIVTDGDGDRGMLLCYDRESDLIRVYDGDDEAFLILGLMKRDGVRTEGSTMICTLESDIMASVSFSEEFGCRSVITDVGDKWICNGQTDDFLIGFESSGHLIMPIRLDGGETLLSGNGLLTAMLSAAAFNEGFRSFRPGFSRTFYTYFVNKQLFGKGSDLFVSDADQLEKDLSKALSGRERLSFSRRLFREPDVLAFQISKDSMVVALIVSRNSGTEDKNAVYLKCIPDLVDILLPVAQNLANRHRQLMRNHELSEARMSEGILADIRDKGRFTVPEDRRSDVRLISVLHALEREGQIRGDGTEFVSV